MMLTTLIFSITAADAGAIQAEVRRAVDVAVSQEVSGGIAAVSSVASRGRIPADTIFVPGISIKTSLQPSILKVSEQSALEVPSGMAAVYLETNRPILSEREAVTLDSMLTALKLSVDPKVVEKPSVAPRAFKVETVQNDGAVASKEEEQQGIFASIQSSVIGI